MASKGSQAGDAPRTRQSTRLTKGASLQVAPRPSLRKRRRELENEIPPTPANGSKDVHDDSEDDESPSKRRRELGGIVGNGCDDHESATLETEEDLEMNEEKMDVEEQEKEQIESVGQCVMGKRASDHSPVPRSFGSPLTVDTNLQRSGDGMNSLETKGILPLRSRRSIHCDWDADAKMITSKPSRNVPVSTTQPPPLYRPQGNSSVNCKRGIQEYRERMELKAKSAGSAGNHQATAHYYKSDGPHTSISHQKPQSKGRGSKTAVQKKKGPKETSESLSIGDKQPFDTKGKSGSACIWCVKVLFVLVLAAVTALGFQYYPTLHWPVGSSENPTRTVKPGELASFLSLMETKFPSQRPELWRRCRIHLERHLQTADPTEPVSLILTAGHKAEKTLHCLATQLASSFSTVLNKSVLHINGASMANRDSDQVKLDIDSQLRRAFEGDKPVAVIHRFEELPPGSTLIFYRYCDHENAAYKQVFLTFTVLLPLDEVEEKHSLKDAEEMVQEYINDRFVGSSSQAAYNRMDTDKFSGLWSRISHLVLPVAAESQIEHEGCQST